MRAVRVGTVGVAQVAEPGEGYNEDPRCDGGGSYPAAILRRTDSIARRRICSVGGPGNGNDGENGGLELCMVESK